MTHNLRTSTLRAGMGAGLLALGLLGALLVLPDASNQLRQQQLSARDAARKLEAQRERLKTLEAEAGMIRRGRARIEELESRMPKGSLGELQFKLSRTLYDLAKVHPVRIQAVKYGTPTKDSAKGTDIENVDVEFTILGVYSVLKGYMLALEGSGLPFGVSSAKLDESQEGARLTVVLRAFRRAGQAQSVVQAEPDKESA